MKDSLDQGEHVKHPAGDSNLGGKPRKTTRKPKKPAYRREVSRNGNVTSVRGANFLSTAPESQETDQPTSQAVIAKGKRGDSAVSLRVVAVRVDR
jgi:hypothetical protein